MSSFSGKQKKAQLKDGKLRRAAALQRANEEEERERTFMMNEAHRRQQARAAGLLGLSSAGAEEAREGTRGGGGEDGLCIAGAGHDHHPKQLKTVLTLEEDKVVQERKRESMLPFERAENVFCSSIEACFCPIPRRPPWSEDMTADELDISERRYLSSYLDDLRRAHGQGLNVFETNINVYRQLWRTMERSDVLLLLVDVRLALFTFPLALYEQAREENKPAILLLTKTDLVSRAFTSAYKSWFELKYPDLPVVLFSTVANKKGAAAKMGVIQPEAKEELLSHVRRFAAQFLPEIPITFDKGETAPSSAATTAAVATAATAAAAAVAVASGGGGKKRASKEEEQEDVEEEEVEEEEGEEAEAEDEEVEEETIILPERRGVRNGFVTLGLVGAPNAGKSSFLNALVGRKRVSVSKTPGHTKHLQTIFLNASVRLCDSPGLVLPMTMDPGTAYPLQVLASHINIAQVRETYSTIAYIASRIDLVGHYKLSPAPKNGWSGFAIADAFAQKKCYFLRGNKTDTHRAGNEILRDVVEGKGLVFCMWPPPPPSPA